MTVKNELSALRSLLEEMRAEMTQSRRAALHDRPPDREIPDPRPVEIPLAYQGEPTMRELVREYVEGAFSQLAEAHQFGTFKEEDDFEEDDPEVLAMSGYEVREFDFVEEMDPADAPDPAPAEQSPDGEAVAEAPQAPLSPPAEDKSASQ